MTESIGAIIRRKREERGWNRNQLGQVIGAHDGRIVRTWEDGICLPSAWYLARLADVFSCTADELLSRPNAVEVVRCLNCALCLEKGMSGRKVILECSRTKTETTPEAFCSWAQREEKHQ